MRPVPNADQPEGWSVETARERAVENPQTLARISNLSGISRPLDFAFVRRFGTAL